MRLRALSTAHPQHPPGAGPSTPGVQTSSGNGTGRPLGDGGDDDVDHALGARLNALRGNRTHAGGRGKGHVVTIEWDERMEVMRRDKAETEARAGTSCARPCPTPLVLVPESPRILTPLPLT